MTQSPRPHNNSEFEYIAENLKQIRFNIGEAKAKYRSPDDDVQIMAVTKTVAPEAVNFAVSQGITLLGENRVQEFLSKKDFYDKTARVHMIGHLQTNKVKYIINEVDLIQSVDSIKLAQTINRLAQQENRRMKILIEVNIGGEDSKSGISTDRLDELIYQCAELDALQIEGLMTIPPVNSGEKLLEKMQGLYLDIKGKNIDNINMNILSMGMSGDYELAIKYGSNLVRLGTKLFGARKYLEVN